jgi:hypothetical protein
MNFIIGLILGILAQVLTFVQLQGQFKYTWMKEHPIILALFGKTKTNIKCEIF